MSPSGRRGRDGLPIEQVDKAIDTVEKLKKYLYEEGKSAFFEISDELSGLT